MFEDYITSVIQNKNVIMFITALLFMAGILAYFNNCAILTAAVITCILFLAGVKKYIPYKYLLLFALVFYFGFFNAGLRIKDSDILTTLAPAEGVITGRIISIPNGNTPDKQSFFFQARKFNDQEVNAKTLVYLTDSSGDFSDLNIGNTYKIQGKLRMPFKASNPSQFDYGKYLRNYKTYTVFYADKTESSRAEEPSFFSSPGRTDAQTAHKLQKAALQLPIPAIDHPGTGHHHHVIARQKPGFIGTVELPNAAAGPVALDGVAQLHPRGDAQTAHRPVGLPAVDGEVGGHGALALAVQPAELMILF